MEPALIIHGGAGRLEGGSVSMEAYREALDEILQATGRELLAGANAREAAVFGMRLFEDNELFNAGTGSKLQSDGRVRMSAALMDGETGRFSGVINIEAVRHPIDVAARLAEERHRVLAGEQATVYARRIGFQEYDPRTVRRVLEFEARRRGECGTCGVLVLDRAGVLCAATSTGGVGYELPGRVSDTPTVAGNCASRNAAVSATGIGEDIVDLAVAARTVVRVEDGLPLPEAVERIEAEGNQRGARFGLIALDAQGVSATGRTKGVDLIYAAWDRDGQRMF